ncbi:MAG: universal stress protein [Verrucomicrobia bacterium]|nr:universal stress protein [Verrucomicrobiota bacterium]
MAVLAEAGLVCRSLSAPLCLIHADAFAQEKEERFRAALRELRLDEQAEIRFEPGQPAEAILKVQDEARIDLLVAGALETESVHRNFTGDVARELLRRAHCDLLLYTEPREDPKPPEGILVAVPDFSELSRQVFRSALILAERSRARRVTILHVQTTFAEAKEKALGVSNGTLPAEETLESWLREEERPALELDYHLLRGNTGFTACEFIQSSGADLVVMPSQMPSSSQPVFAPALDWIIQVIPANLWVIRR